MEQKSVWISAFLPLCRRNKSSAISFWCCFSYIAILALNLPLSYSKSSSCLDSLVFKRFHIVLRHSAKRSSGAGLPSERTSPKLNHIHFLAVFLSHQRIFQIRSHWCIAENQNSFILFKFDNPLEKSPLDFDFPFELLAASAYGPVRSSQLNTVKSQFCQLSVF